MNSNQILALGVANWKSTLDAVFSAPPRWSKSSTRFSGWLASITPPAGEENNNPWITIV